MKQRIQMFLCGAALLGAATVARAIEPGFPPASNFDLSHWKLTLPIDAFGGTATTATEISTAQLLSGYISPYFYSGPAGEMVFWCSSDGARTSGSSYPRSELREMLNPTNSAINWSGYGTHCLNARCRVTQQPASRKLIIGQIHGYTGAARPLVKLQFNNGSIEALVKHSPNLDTDTKYSFGNVGLGNPLAYQIKVVDGLLTVTVNGLTKGTNIFVTDPDWANQTMYFKAGNYLQDNTGISTNGAVVSFSELSITHSPGLNVYPPVIGSVPAQTVDPGVTASVPIPASDSDVPPQSLSFLLLNAPAGATLNSSGRFTWTPSLPQAGTTNLITLSVTDDGFPSLSTTQSFTVVVNPLRPCDGFKADVTPRGNPNGFVSIADWVQIGRFAAGMDTVSNECELARADCAPRPCGNGVITIADWVQAGRLAAGLDAALPMADCPPASGFFPAEAAPQFAPAAGLARSISAGTVAIERGETGRLQVSLHARGGENGLQFSLSFDPNLLAYAGAKLTGGALNAALFIQNTNQLAQGRIGFFIGLNAGQSFSEGLQQIVELNFRATAGGSLVSTAVAFWNQPIACEVVDLIANPVPAIYQNGSVLMTSANTAAWETITMGGTGRPTLTLLGTPGGVWEVEESLDLRSWRRVATVTNLSGRLGYSDRLSPPSSQRFYRAVRP